MRRQIAVIGLGRFGVDLVNALANKNVDVIGVDKDKTNVAKIGDVIENAVVCDSTNAESLKEAGLGQVDNAILAFGQDNQANLATSILTIVALRKIGCKKITCRADSKDYEELLLKIGADEVLLPFEIASESLALKVSSDSVMDYYHVTEGYNVFQMEISNKVYPIKLLDLNARERFGINILLYSRNGKTEFPDKNYILTPGDHIFCFGKEKSVYQLENYLLDRDRMEMSKGGSKNKKSIFKRHPKFDDTIVEEEALEKSNKKTKKK